MLSILMPEFSLTNEEETSEEFSQPQQDFESKLKEFELANLRYTIALDKLFVGYNTLEYVAKNGLNEHVYYLSQNSIDWNVFLHKQIISKEDFTINNNYDIKIIAQEGLKEIGQGIWKFLKNVFEKIKNFFKKILRFLFGRSAESKRLHEKVEKNAKNIADYEKEYGRMNKNTKFRNSGVEREAEKEYIDANEVLKGLKFIENISKIQIANLVPFMVKGKTPEGVKFMQECLSTWNSSMHEYNATLNEAKKIRCIEIIEKGEWKKHEECSSLYVKYAGMLAGKADTLKATLNSVEKLIDEGEKASQNGEKVEKGYITDLKNIQSVLKDLIKLMTTSSNTLLGNQKYHNIVVNNIASMYIVQYNRDTDYTFHGF